MLNKEAFYTTIKSFRWHIGVYDIWTEKMLTCSLQFLFCHDPVFESAPQSGIDPKECLIANTNQQQISLTIYGNSPVYDLGHWLLISVNSFV